MQNHTASAFQANQNVSLGHNANPLRRAGRPSHGLTRTLDKFLKAFPPRKRIELPIYVASGPLLRVHHGRGRLSLAARIPSSPLRLHSHFCEFITGGGGFNRLRAFLFIPHGFISLARVDPALFCSVTLPTGRRWGCLRRRRPHKVHPARPPPEGFPRVLYIGHKGRGGGV